MMPLPDETVNMSHSCRFLQTDNHFPFDSFFFDTSCWILRYKNVLEIIEVINKNTFEIVFEGLQMKNKLKF